MPISLPKLRKLLRQADREQLLGYFDIVLDTIDETQIDVIFGDLYYEQVTQQLSPEEVLQNVQQFHTDSMAGKYYAPFQINSKNYAWIPPETETWFSEMATWLDRSCELAEQGKAPIAKQCLDLLMELVGEMNAGEEIVFADELGDHLIYARHDYRAIHQKLSQQAR